MDDNNILDDLIDDQHDNLPDSLIDAVINCAKYARLFVIVYIMYDVIKFILNYFVMQEYQKSIGDIYGSFLLYGIQSITIALVSLTSVYFLWQFAKKGITMELNRNQEFADVLKSLKHYFMASLFLLVLFRILRFIGPLFGQFFATF